MDELVVRGKLKLKAGKVGKKKPKSTTVSKEKIEAIIAAGEESDDDQASRSSSNATPPVQEKRQKTKAELAFEKRQAQLQTQRVHKKAQESHRERVEKFNKYLENLTEQNDIPKVSWTK